MVDCLIGYFSYRKKRFTLKPKFYIFYKKGFTLDIDGREKTWQTVLKVFNDMFNFVDWKKR